MRPRHQRGLIVYSMSDFKKLKVWQKAHDMSLLADRIAKTIRAADERDLRSQLKRSSASVPTNIVEGCAREGESDYLRFLDISFASCRELLYLISVARRLSFIREDDALRLSQTGDRVAGALVNLRRALRR